jgi:hypothetical protein
MALPRFQFRALSEPRDIPERSAVEQEQELFELLTSSPRLKAGDSRG